MAVIWSPRDNPCVNILTSKRIKQQELSRSESPGDPKPFGISLVLPMYNEAPAIEATLRKTIEALEANFSDFEIVIADDASTDGCAEEIERRAAADPRIRLVRLPENQCFGGALRAGLDAARKDFLIYTDFDLPVALSCLPGVIENFQRADVLTGFAAEGMKHASVTSAIMSKVYNLLVRTFFDVHLRDINFGFKALRRSAWKMLDLRSCSPFVDAELFIRAQSLGLCIAEVPVPFEQRAQGESHIRRLDVIAITMLDMARLKMRAFGVHRAPLVSPVASARPQR